MDTDNTPPAAPPKRRGRPAKSRDDKMVPKSMRLTPKQWEKVHRIGWDKIRSLIDQFSE